MLPRAHRLKDQNEFTKIYNLGKKFYSPYFLLFVQMNNSPMPSKNISKFGVVASRKVGSAVARNRSKRLLREAIRLELPKLKNNFTAIIIASPQTAKAKFLDLHKSLQTFLQKADLYENPPKIQLPG